MINLENLSPENSAHFRRNIKLCEAKLEAFLQEFQNHYAAESRQSLPSNCGLLQAQKLSYLIST